VPGAWRSRVADLGGNRAPQDLLKEVLREVDGSATLVLVGNIHGQGEVLLEQIDRLPEVPRAALAMPGIPRQRGAPRQIQRGAPHQIQRGSPRQMWHGDGYYADPRYRDVRAP
jgi:hypothetical protein